MRAVELSLSFRQLIKKNLFLILSLALVIIGGFLSGILPLEATLLSAIMLPGLFLGGLAIVSKRTRGITIVLILVILPLISIVKGITGSRFAPLVFDLALLLACGIYLLEGLVKGKLRFGKLDFLLAILWGLALIGMLNPNVPSVQAGIEGFRKFIFMSIAFYISRHMLELKDFRLFIKGLLLVSIPVTLYGIKQFFVMWPIDYRMIDLATASSVTYLMGGWIRPFSTMSGPFQLGLYLMISLLLILALLTKLKLRPSLRTLLIGLFTLQIALLLMTRTKGNWGGFIIGAIVLFVFQSRNPIRAAVRLTGFSIIGGTIILLLYSFSIGETLTILDDAIFAITHPLEAPTFIFRMDLWQESVFPALQQQPILGYGTSSASEGLRNLYSGTNSLYFASHNLYLKIWLELGIIGLIVFLWIVGESLWRGTRQMHKAKSNNPHLTVLLQWGIACVFAFLVSGLVIPNLDAYPVNYYFWLLLGLLSGTNKLSKKI